MGLQAVVSFQLLGSQCGNQATELDRPARALIRSWNAAGHG